MDPESLAEKMAKDKLISLTYVEKVAELLTDFRNQVEAVTIERAAIACGESDGWDMYPKDYARLVRALGSDPTYLTRWDEKMKAEGRLEQLKKLQDVAELIGDPYKIFGLIQDSISEFEALKLSAERLAGREE